MKLMISEILEQASHIKSRKDKIAFLQKHNSIALQRILHAIFDPQVEFLLPDDDPKYTPALDYIGHEMLYTESRKLYHFMKGGNDNLAQHRRETMFIELLETIHPKEAAMMLKVRKKRSPFPTITESLVREAFPSLLSEKPEKENKEVTNESQS